MKSVLSSSEHIVNHYDHGRLISSCMIEEYVFQSFSQSPTAALFRTAATRTITPYELLLLLRSHPLTMFVVVVVVVVVVAAVAVVVEALYYIAIVLEANITRAFIGEAQLNARALFYINAHRPITHYAY